MAFDLGILGVRKNIPKVNFTDYCGILIAPPKFGKTTIASLYPNAVICAFEKGYQAQVVNVVDTPTWEDFIVFIDKLEKNRKEIGDAVKTVVLDTVNEAHDKCGVYALKYLSKQDQKKYVKPIDVPFGGYYTELDKQFKLQIDRLLNLGFMPMYLSHNKMKTVKPKNGEPYDVYVSTMSERCEKIVYPAVDYIIYGERKKITNEVTGDSALKRVLVVKGNEETEAGSRVHINSDIIFDTEAEAMEKFQQAFRANIEEKLKQAGIKGNLDTLAKQQEEEKMNKVNEYILSQNVRTNEELVNEIKGKFPKAPKEIQSQIVATMKEQGVSSFENPDAISKEVLQNILEFLG